MGRATDTRERVRREAEFLRQQGIEPTCRGIRERLGGGSPNTIMDELRRWREGHTGVEAASRINVGARVAPEAPSPAPPDSTRRLEEKLDALAAAVSNFAQAAERLEDMQKRALLLVDEARARGRYWEEEAKRLRSENREKEEHYRQAMYRAQDECNFLRGRLAERGQPDRAAEARALPDGRLFETAAASRAGGGHVLPGRQPLSGPSDGSGHSAYDADGRSLE